MFDEGASQIHMLPPADHSDPQGVKYAASYTDTGRQFFWDC